MRRQVEAMVLCGVDGIAVLGLASEVHKLTGDERRTLLEWTAEDLVGRLPLAVTVAEPSVRSQVDFVRAAAGLGASWVILQPSPARDVPEIEALRFLGAVAEGCQVPVGLQVAPGYLGAGFSVDGLKALQRNHPNVQLLKVEENALALHELVDGLDGTWDVFNGRAGLQMPDVLRAGCAGLIPGAETADVHARVYRACREGAAADDADATYATISGLITFMEHSIDAFLVHGKPLLARRIGLDPGYGRVRAPCSRLTDFGRDAVARHAAALGPL
jgi:4-hydroxy-tetrahydrodipicolinate synthase